MKFGIGKLATVLLLMLGVFLFWRTSMIPSARSNPEWDHKGSVTLQPVSKIIGNFSSYGFAKSTWLSGFSVNVHVKSQFVEDQEFLELLVSILNDCSLKINPTAYASEVYLSPQNPCLYYVLIHDRTPSSEEERENTLIFDKGVARRIKGVDLCHDEEKKLLKGKKSGVVWRKSIDEILASTSADHSALKLDPLLVFNFTDDDDRRSVALLEVAKINKSFKEKGYSILDQRMLTTGLKNKGALREWFFEYHLPKKEYDTKDTTFRPEFVKQKWIEVAREILGQLNMSTDLAKYRDNLWDLKNLRLNIGSLKKYMSERCYVTWSHFVIEYMRYSQDRKDIVERKFVKIPLDEFYTWAEAELNNLSNESPSEVSSDL